MSKRSRHRYSVLLGGASIALLAGPESTQASFYWDTDATTSGIQGGSGTWAAGSTNFTTTSDGSGTHGGGPTSATSGNDTFFSYGTLPSASYSVTVAGALSTAGMTFNDTGYTLSTSSGTSTITLGGTGVVVAAGKTATIGSGVKLTRSAGVGTSGGGTLNIATNATLESSSSTSTFNIFSGPTTATVNVNGGAIQTGGGSILVSNGGTLTLTSGTITTPVGKTLAISDTTNGIVNLNGGTLLTGQISKAAGSGTATLNFAGGVLKAAASDTPSAAATTFLTGLTTANVKDGGAIVDTASFNVTIAQALVHFANATTDGLRKISPGTLTLSGANTYSGLTDVQGGTLTLAGSAIGTVSGDIHVASSATFTPGGTFTVAANKTLSGSGTVSNSVVASGATLSPGDTSGVLTVQGGLTLNSASILNFDLATAASTTDDQIALSTAANRLLVLDGTLNITNAGGFGPGVYTLISGATGITDQGLLIGTAPAGYTYTFSTAGSDVLLTVAAPEPASLAMVIMTVGGLLARRRRSVRSDLENSRPTQGVSDEA